MDKNVNNQNLIEILIFERKKAILSRVSVYIIFSIIAFGMIHYMSDGVEIGKKPFLTGDTIKLICGAS